jgi:hypothetical protein
MIDCLSVRLEQPKWSIPARMTSDMVTATFRTIAVHQKENKLEDWKEPSVPSENSQGEK